MPWNKNRREKQSGPGPVWGCVLIGGQSRRMGTPKHLLEKDGMTWLELILTRLRERADQVVISGSGAIPDGLQGIPVVRDAAGLCGPLSGIVSIFRHYPGISWLVAACDMPEITVAALDWILERRAPGVKAILPDLEGNGFVEPLLAYYDQSCLEMLEEMVDGLSMRPGDFVGKPGVITPQPPVAIRSCWKNVNFPEDLNS